MFIWSLFAHSFAVFFYFLWWVCVLCVLLLLCSPEWLILFSHLMVWCYQRMPRTQLYISNSRGITTLDEIWMHTIIPAVLHTPCIIITIIFDWPQMLMNYYGYMVKRMASVCVSAPIQIPLIVILIHKRIQTGAMYRF